VSDKNGDAHFKYHGIFLSVNCDIKIEQTYEVYILKKRYSQDHESRHANLLFSFICLINVKNDIYIWCN